MQDRNGGGRNVTFPAGAVQRERRAPFVPSRGLSSTRRVRELNLQAYEDNEEQGE